MIYTVKVRGEAYIRANSPKEAMIKLMHTFSVDDIEDMEVVDVEEEGWWNSDVDV